MFDPQKALNYQRALATFARIVGEADSDQRLLQNATAQIARITHIRHVKVLRYRPDQGDWADRGRRRLGARRRWACQFRCGSPLVTRALATRAGSSRTKFRPWAANGPSGDAQRTGRQSPGFRTPGRPTVTAVAAM